MKISYPKTLYRLKNLTSFISRGVAPSYVENGGVVVLNQKCIRGWKVSYEQARLTSEEKINSGSEKVLRDLDILICSTGVGTLGRVAQFESPKHRITVDSHVSIVRADEKKVNPIFLGYILKKSEQLIESLAEGSTGQTELSRKKLQEFEVSLPSREHQDEVISIFQLLDKKIENNNTITTNLELLMRSLFDEWFVKFNFPGNKNETGFVPKGWSSKNLEEVADVLFGYAFKAELFNESGDGVKVVRIRDILSGTTETFSPEQVEEKYRINSGDLIIGMDGTFHVSMWFSNDCYLNQRVARIRSEMPTYFILQSIRTKLDFLQKTITGATVGHLSNGDIRGFKILLPEDKALLGPFKNATEKILELKQENVVLRDLRDKLLAKLI